MPGAELADGAASKTLAADKGLEVEAELALMVPVWFNPEAAAKSVTRLKKPKPFPNWKKA